VFSVLMSILPKLADMEKVTFNKLFGEFVRLKRIELKLSQAQLGDKMELDFQYISRVERGLISPTLFWIIGLATSLDMPLDVFIKEFADYSGLETAAINP
jgi:transcriptional regulator with XRE-family HTH domain